MTGTVNISIYAPPMPIKTLSWRLRRTAIEPMKAIIDFSSPDRVLVIEPVTIPETDVRRLGLLSWMVDACIGSGRKEGNRLIVWLPEEPVRWHWSKMTMVAEKITCPVKLFLADGSIAEGNVEFPDCPVDLFSGVAQAVTATGTATFS